MTENLNNDEESRLIERLILGEEVCDEGDIFVQYDGNQITSHFQGNIGLISQHPFLFNDPL